MRVERHSEGSLGLVEQGSVECAEQELGLVEQGSVGRAEQESQHVAAVADVSTEGESCPHGRQGKRSSASVRKRRMGKSSSADVTVSTVGSSRVVSKVDPSSTS